MASIVNLVDSIQFIIDYLENNTKDLDLIDSKQKRMKIAETFNQENWKKISLKSDLRILNEFIDFIDFQVVPKNKNINDDFIKTHLHKFDLNGHVRFWYHGDRSMRREIKGLLPRITFKKCCTNEYYMKNVEVKVRQSSNVHPDHLDWIIQRCLDKGRKLHPRHRNIFSERFSLDSLNKYKDSVNFRKASKNPKVNLDFIIKNYEKMKYTQHVKDILYLELTRLEKFNHQEKLRQVNGTIAGIPICNKYSKDEKVKHVYHLGIACLEFIEIINENDENEEDDIESYITDEVPNIFGKFVRN